MNLKKNIKSNKAITLVALVVTIVVLLILAGITIAALFSDNGIIAAAQKASDETKEAVNTTEKELENLAADLSKVLNNNSEKAKTLTPEDKGGALVTGKNATYTETIGGVTYTAPIPVGFCVVADITGDENTIPRGLVISDVAEDDLNNTKKGNQFVWVPVTYSDFHLREGYSNNNLQTFLDKTKTNPPAREAGAREEAGIPMTDNSTAGSTESIAMYKSVKDNGGFYIARYEAGIAGTNSSTTTNDANKQTQNGDVKPVLQKGVGVWNFIPWGGTQTVEASDNLPGNDNANGAVKVARSLYPETDTAHNVTSTLIYGVQWDAALKFIDPEYTGYAKDSTNMGNYSGSLAATGSNNSYQQKHIYDMAGNVWEWTMEAYNTYAGFRIGRGGSYDNAGSNYPASFRSGNGPGNTNGYLGFRLALYL